MRLVTTTAALAALAAFAVAGPAGAASQASHAAPIRVTVTAGEFYFKFSKARVPRGSTVVFTVINRGKLAHNLVFQSLNNKHTPLLSPGTRTTLRITFTKAGHYYYLCSVPNHAESGMAGSFVVT